MKLIPNWKQLYKFSSVQFMIAAGALQSVWVELPADIKADLPKNIVHFVSLALLIGGVIARAIKQNLTDTAATPPN